MKKLIILTLFVAVTYISAYAKVYQQTANYFHHAQAQEHDGNYIEALKGLDKIDLRIDEDYIGGYQQVIEAWEQSGMKPKPSFYYESQPKPKDIIGKMTNEQLDSFIDVYLELDNKYVLEAAQLRYNRAIAKADTSVAESTAELLTAAFDYQPK